MPSWDRPQSREDTRASAHADTAAPTPPPLQALPPFPRRGIKGYSCTRRRNPELDEVS